MGRGEGGCDPLSGTFTSEGPWEALRLSSLTFDQFVRSHTLENGCAHLVFIRIC